MIWIAVSAIGFVVGFAVGRWFALAIAVGFGAWIWHTTGVDVPHWLLGFLYGGAAAVGIATGVTARLVLTKQTQN